MKTIYLSREIATARGALAAPFFTWLAKVTLAVTFYTLTASAPTLGDTAWTDAARLGTGWWMTAFGGEVAVDGVPISLMPLTITFIVMYASYAAFRKREVSSWGEVAAAAITQAAVVGTLGLLIRPEGAWWPAVIGAFGIGFATATFAARYYLVRWEWLYFASHRTRLLLRAIAISGSVAFLLGVIVGWSRIVEIHGYYLTGVVGGIGLVVLQLAYLLVAPVWAFAWLVGAGFAVGEGTQFSVLGVESAPLPAIPMLGALPPVSTGIPWMLALVAIIFLVLGVVVTRREDTGLKVSLGNAAIAVVIASLTVAVLGLMASGAIGPERMTITGPVPAELFGFTLLVVGLPFLLGTVVSHEDSIAFVRGQAGELKAKRAARREEADSAAKTDSESATDDAQATDRDELARDVDE